MAIASTPALGRPALKRYISTLACSITSRAIICHHPIPMRSPSSSHALPCYGAAQLINPQHTVTVYQLVRPPPRPLTPCRVMALRSSSTLNTPSRCISSSALPTAPCINSLYQLAHSPHAASVPARQPSPRRHVSAYPPSPPLCASTCSIASSLAPGRPALKQYTSTLP